VFEDFFDGEVKMDQKQIVLAGLYPSSQKIHSPVQVQKLFFLLDRNIPKLITGPLFNFQPYNYGPFDKAVYEIIEVLTEEGLAEIIPSYSRLNYRLTCEGQEEGEKIFKSLNPLAQNYISDISNFVLSLSFSSLVSAIYKAYPEMRENSVFQE
jgi:hypothetical protein